MQIHSSPKQVATCCARSAPHRDTSPPECARPCAVPSVSSTATTIGTSAGNIPSNNPAESAPLGATTSAPDSAPGGHARSAAPRSAPPPAAAVTVRGPCANSVPVSKTCRCARGRSGEQARQRAAEQIQSRLAEGTFAGRSEVLVDIGRYRPRPSAANPSGPSPSLRAPRGLPARPGNGQSRGKLSLELTM